MAAIPQKPFLAGSLREDFAAWCVKECTVKFRANQIAEWIYRHDVLDPMEMKNLPLPLRGALKTDFLAPGSSIAQTVTAPDGTEKLLIELHDGETVEMVLIPGREERLTFCLSTQVGCPVGCLFCASGRDGLIRNLAAGEIIEEFLLGSKRAGRRPDSIVFMGIGEGLLNFHELSKALHVLTSPDYIGMSPRRITVSTSGYVPGMLKFAELGREFTLAISLHAPDDETRARIIPDKVRYPIAEIMAAADRYLETAGRMVTIEYTLLAGINDSHEAAVKLARLARAHHAKVNLIPYNATDSRFQRPSRQVIEEFERTVFDAGAHVTLRTERGFESSAACGQLRAKSRH
ncbi:23S rRNA (adenine(2503)-C(2))-methyltransferase RlmN [uncultured Victivallis sp.]|uniref:23S rRNA (adenine(2503)-C(2))-methyltransferase RlmN n=1 Tax=uncultured Victivallis sp. TaxID=354118 RepID=UPI0025EA0131|nr:23S rRNA (adenine(2503)-C(2))-methyltransferase RlmN [uncultured Victivallis sp.]